MKSELNTEHSSGSKGKITSGQSVKRCEGGLHASLKDEQVAMDRDRGK